MIFFRKPTTDPRIRIDFDGGREGFSPGESLSGECRLPSDLAAETERLTVSVLWRTEGKGDEDTGTHFSRTLSADEGHDFYRPQHFETVLPPSPLSYDGVIVKVVWCVRVQTFRADRQEFLAEAPFRLGDVPAAREAAS